MTEQPVLEIVRLLIEAGADPFANEFGEDNCALSEAKLDGLHSVVETIINAM